MSSDLERLLRRAAAGLAGPDAAATTRAREAAVATARARRLGRRGRRALTMSGAALAAVALGVGLGSLTLPGRGAASGPAGLGFLPAQGWFVLQSAAAATSDRPGLAIAANVPLHAEDAAGGLPYSTLQALPDGGVVMVASFVRLVEPNPNTPSLPRGRLPLRLRDAEPYIAFGGEVRPRRPLGQYELRAIVNGYTVDVQAYFGTRKPTEAMLAEAQRQLDRLVVSPDRGSPEPAAARLPGRSSDVTIAYQRYYDAGNRLYKMRFFGTISSGAANEYVAVLQQRCGSTSSTAVAGASTVAGGSWEVVTDRAYGSAVYRARWNDQLSSPVSFRPAIDTRLSKLGRGRYRVTVSTFDPVGNPQSMKGRLVELQRLAGGAWTRVRSAKLTAAKGDAYLRSSSATFTVATRGLTLRILVPAASAAPCYKAAVTKTFRS